MLPRGHQVLVCKRNGVCLVCEELDAVEDQVELEGVQDRQLEGEQGAELVEGLLGLGGLRGVLPGREDEDVLLRLFLAEDKSWSCL